MIEFTIKTLDSNNHPFSVDDEMTVLQLKEKVRENLGIGTHQQRLIFCGRVMQDEKKLAEYDVHGKVVHLVQRMPPSQESRQSSNSGATATNTTNDSNTGAQQQIRRLMAMAGQPGFMLEEQQALTMSPTTGRLEFIRRMIAEIRTSLANLREHVEDEENSAPASSDAPVESMDNEPASGATQEEIEPMLDENGEDASDAATRAQNARRRAIRALRARHSRPRDLGQLVEELENLQDQFSPYRATYITMLRAANNPEPPQYTEEERQREQRTVDMISDIIHSFAHAYHAVSDINFQVGQRNPRLTSEAVLRHPIPMQAHINVVQPNRRVQQQNNANPSGNGSATATETSASAAAAASANATSGEPAPPNSQAGRNPGQPSGVNINIQPDPITYQVEIETRMPIAFALENALLNGLTTPANQQPQGEQNQAPNQAGAQNQSGQQANAADPANPPGQQNQAGQGNRRQVLFDFENLFRGLGQGVEVVMSMEEIPHSVQMAGFGGGLNANGVGHLPSTMPLQPDGGNNPQPHFGADIYLGAMPWGGPPSADLLQNIVSSVIRQGLVPGMEGVLHAQGPQQAGAGSAATAGAQGGLGAVGTLGSLASLGGLAGLGNIGAQTGHAGQAGAQAGQDQANGQARQPSLHLRRATTTTRAAAISLANLVYDRFLACDSLHARRRLQRRREQHQHQIAQQERLRADRAAAQNIEALRDRNTNITQNHMQTLVQLLNSSPSQESWVNALMVAIARQLFLSEQLPSATGEPPLMPNEFQHLRLLLRNYIDDLLARSGNTDGDNAFQAVADFFIEQHADFINNMNSITPIRPEVDVYMTLQALIRCRLPAVIACVMSDSTSEAFAARFYQMFSRLYTDVCTLVTYCCREGIDGMRLIYRAYLEQAISGFEEPVRQLITTLSMENLNQILHRLAPHMDAIQPYVRRRTFLCSPSQTEDEAIAMETSPPNTPAIGEPMQTSPAAPPMEEELCTVCARAAAYASAPETVTGPEPAEPAVPSAPPAPPSPPAPGSPTTPASPAASHQTTPNHTATSTSESSPLRSANMRIPKIEITETATSERNGTPDNVRFVPPVLLLQHWGEEWVPVFTRDQQRQQERPATPEPYSDAYMSGMPARKRRCVRQNRPPTQLEPLLNVSVREAVERSAPVPDNMPLRRAFREYMRNAARTRAVSSEDYDPQHYASAERFLGPTRHNPEQPESAKEPQ
ncbi:large proline-rich protein BAG6 isoform X2 [Pectinophora gossypiella]|nr:large proline-rich protein BAG6 isoform X2 [Pectinophora gossypiella]